MLIFDVSANRREQIDEIYVQRVIGRPIEGETCGYIIKKPRGFSDPVIKHIYSDGYFPLMVKVIDILNLKGYRPKK